MATDRLLSHAVYFTLHNASDEAKHQLVAACKQYLSEHPGTVFFAVGSRAADFTRPVNDHQFDVALQVVFRSKTYHDQYQQSDIHQTFIDQQKNNWKQVRVFDSYVES